MARLLILNDTSAPEHVLSQNSTIGRLPECHLTISDLTISRFHCLISFKRGKGFFIKDLGSENGTFVNDEKCVNEYLLCDGDVILVGSTRLVFKEKIPAECIGYVDEPADALAGKIEQKTDPMMASRFLNIQEIRSQAHLKADYERLRIAYEIFKDIGIDNDLDTILGLVLNRIHEILVFDRGIALLMDKDGGFKTRAYKTRKPDDKITVSSRLVSYIVDTKQSVLVKDILTDERFASSESLVGKGVRATLAVPVTLNNDMFGMLIIESTSASRSFSKKDLNLVTNIANQIAKLIGNKNLVAQIERDAVLRERFQKHFSPDIAELIVSGKLKIKRGGETRMATVLFADIRGFTALCEKVSSAEILKLLNECFELMADVVFQYGGTVDKFIGDSLMAIWGTAIRHENDPLRAICAALDIQRRMSAFNELREKDGAEGINIGIGISSGSLVAGYIGSSRTMNYSVIGDTVNIASRLCSAASGKQILISESTFSEADGFIQCRKIGPLKVRGKAVPVNAFSVSKATKETKRMMDLLNITAR